MHARAAHGFVHVKQIFALAEGIQHDRHRATVQPVTANPQQMIEQARDLGIHHADVLRTLGHFNAHHLFNRQAIRMLVAHHRDIIQAIHVGERLDVGARLSQFFCAAMQEADVRIGALDHFTIQLQHQAQHAMGCWVLWTEI